MYIYASSILDQQYILSLIKQPHKIGDFVSWALLIASGGGIMIHILLLEDISNIIKPRNSWTSRKYYNNDILRGHRTEMYRKYHRNIITTTD